jgi:hypothetical protein
MMANDSTQGWEVAPGSQKNIHMKSVRACGGKKLPKEFFWQPLSYSAKRVVTVLPSRIQQTKST